ncbi:MAG: SBBP repeat-containing protein [Bryobacterales bacterium]|nr:SBBP repeat-containing protein [Bryobacterales bacterium]
MLPGVGNYLMGRDRGRWRTGVPHYKGVRMEGVYRGIDIEFHEAGGALEFDFLIAAGADPRQIRMAWEGIQETSLDGSGTFVALAKGGTFALKQPLVYQERDGKRLPVRSRYRISKRGVIGLELDQYDAATALVVDPVVAYSSYTASEPMGITRPAAMAVDGAGNLFFVQNVNGRVQVVKLDPSGVLLLSTVVGGSNGDAANSVVLDAAGNIYVAGYTASTDFPVVNAIQKVLTPPSVPIGTGSDDQWDGFLLKLAPDMKSILYSTYLGGSRADEVQGIAVDAKGSLYGAVSTKSADFPTTSGAYQINAGGRYDAVIFKVSPAGNQLVYSTYFGGSGNDFPGIRPIAVDGAGNAYIIVASDTGDIPVTSGPIGKEIDGGFRPYVAKLNLAGTALLYCNYLGANNNSYPLGIAVDEAGHAYIAGSTSANDFPTTEGAFLRNASPAPDADPGSNFAWYVGFASKWNSQGTGLIYSTYAGQYANAAENVALDPSGALFLVGRALYPFPTGIPRALFGIPLDAFAAKLNPAGTSLSALLFGGSDDDVGTTIALGPNSRVYVAGNTYSSDFPTTPGALQTVSPTRQVKSFLTYLDGFEVSMAPCVTSLAADTSPILPQGGTRNITVTAPGNCTWSASASMPFLRITQGSTGTGNGTVSIAVDARRAGDNSVQSGYLVVESQMVPFIQPPWGQDGSPYSDVDPSAPFAGHVALVAQHLDLSVRPGVFSPNAPVTRRLMARAVISSLLGTDNFQSPSNPYFSDVPASDPDFRYVQKLREAGITAGCTQDRFCPDDVVTRGQMAAFLWRSLAGERFQVAAAPTFSDVPAGHLFYRYIQRIRNWGITAGCTAATYCPDDPILKWQLAVFLARSFYTPR